MSKRKIAKLYYLHTHNCLGCGYRYTREKDEDCDICKDSKLDSCPNKCFYNKFGFVEQAKFALRGGDNP